MRDFKSITLREEITSRGGGVEISLDTLGFPGERMSAYQNYLGGGMLGRVCVNDTIRCQSGKPFLCEDSNILLDDIGEELKQYFFNLTNPDNDSWEHQSYIQNQNTLISGY